jgi:hypothetical protein
MLLKFEELERKDQEKIQDVYQVLDRYKKFSNQASLKLFQYLFQERGEYLWRKFIDHEKDIFSFFSYASLDVKSTIIVNVEKNETLYAYT